MSVASLAHLISQYRHLIFIPLSLESRRRERGAPEESKPWKERKETVKINGGSIETIDLQPEKLTDEVPVLVAPAWAGSIEAYRNALETLAEQGRRVVSLNHARHGGELPAPEDLPELLKDMPTEELRKAESLLALLESKGIKQVDVVAHSEGAANALAAILLAPERFRNIVLVGPAGLIGEDNPIRLAKGFIKDSLMVNKPTLEEIPISEEEKEYRQKRGIESTNLPKLPGPPFSGTAFLDMVKYMASNPHRSVQEIIDIARTRLEEVIKEAHRRGVGIVIMSNVDDPVFPTGEISKMVNGQMIDGFLSMRGGHGEIVGKPEHFMTAAEEMLRSLHAKQLAAEQNGTTPSKSTP
jgi:pimeloyl-ACP methyl ester carboxylesterase